MRKLWLLFIMLVLSALIISGCSSEEEPENNAENNSEENETETEENENDEEEVVEEEEENDEENAEETAGSGTTSGNFSDLVTYMEEATEGTANVIYERNEPVSHTMEGVTVTLDAYTLVELKDFHTNFSIPFNDQTDGGVIIAQYTVTNEMEEVVYYMPSLSLSFTGASKAYSNNRDLLPVEDQLPSMLSPDTDYELAPGETVTGFYTYPFGQDHLEEVLELSVVQVEVPAPQAVKGEFGSPIGKDGKFHLSLNEEGEERVAHNAAFYQDKVTTDDMGEKVMIEEKEDIGETETVGDFGITFEGYQFTEFTPNAEEAPRFENFQNGVVLFTAKFQIENNSSDVVSLSSMSSKLTVNDGAQYMLGEGMLLNYTNRDLIEAGQSGELLQIFVLDQEQYEKIWKDKSFELEIGPVRNDEATDISKGKKAVFSF